MASNERDIARLADTWFTAERTADSTLQAEMLHEQFVGIGPLGFTLTRDEWLARFSSGKLHYEALDIDEMSVRAFEGAAIVIARQTQEAKAMGMVVKAELRVSVTFVREADRWMVAEVQMSSIKKPPQFTKQ